MNCPTDVAGIYGVSLRGVVVEGDGEGAVGEGPPRALAKAINLIGLPIGRKSKS